MKRTRTRFAEALGRAAVLTGVAACLLSETAGAQTVEVLKNFGFTGGRPQAGVIQATDGNFYGTTSTDYGAIFKIGGNGNTFVTLHTFANVDGANPNAGLVQATDGNLYGTTGSGGASNNGTIFRIDMNGSTFTTLHNFAGTDGAYPYAALIQGSDGNLYGTTAVGGGGYGTIFRMSTNGSSFTTLHSFAGGDGGYPVGLVEGADGNLYGATQNGGASDSGTIFRMSMNGTSFTTLHSFSGSGSDGATPYSGLIQGTDGNFYGTTYQGGTSSWGTIFRIDSNGSTFAVLHSFAYDDGANPRAALIQGSDGMLYGTAGNGEATGNGSVFRIDTGGSTFTTVHSFDFSDGSFPYAALFQGTDGNLYGTTNWGGASFGTIFKVDPRGSTFATLHVFGFSEGGHPWGGLIQGVDGHLYGTTTDGGARGYGTTFKLSTDGSSFTMLHSFAYTEGAQPYCSLAQAGDGYLYGTDIGGGAYCPPGGCGTIFKSDTNGTTVMLASLDGNNGTSSEAGLIQATDGNLYGTAAWGGLNGGYGTVFKVDPNGSALTVLHSFGGVDGKHPYAALVQGADGNLYGTTGSGGANGAGAIFKIDPKTSTFAVLHSFAGGDGADPETSLIQGTDGDLYGTTLAGGERNNGTIFRIDTNSSTLTTLHSFAYDDGAIPVGGVIQGLDGNLYGTTYQGGANGYGTIFRLDMSGSRFSTLHSFNGLDGANPIGALIRGTDGKFYGTTYVGGSGFGQAGVVFRVSIETPLRPAPRVVPFR